MAVKNLTVEVSADGIRLTEFTEAQITRRDGFLFKERLDHLYKEQVEAFFKDREYNLSDFEDCVVSWASKETALVPGAVFSESDPESVYRLCFNFPVPSQQIDYNRIPELQLVNVFDIPHWLKSFFVIRFPRVIIQHEGTLILRGIFGGSTFKPKAIAVLHKEYFTLIIVKDNTLQFYSTFEYQSAEDVVYYMSYTLQQKELLNEISEIQLIEGIESERGLLTTIESLLQKVGDFKNAKIYSDKEQSAKFLNQCV